MSYRVKEEFKPFVTPETVTERGFNDMSPVLQQCYTKEEFEIGKFYAKDNTIFYCNGLGPYGSVFGYGFEDGKFIVRANAHLGAMAYKNKRHEWRETGNHYLKSSLINYAIKKYPIGSRIKYQDTITDVLQGHQFVFSNGSLYSSGREGGFCVGEVMNNKGQWAGVQDLTYKKMIDDVGAQLMFKKPDPNPDFTDTEKFSYNAQLTAFIKLISKNRLDLLCKTFTELGLAPVFESAGDGSCQYLELTGTDGRSLNFVFDKEEGMKLRSIHLAEPISREDNSGKIIWTVKPETKEL